MQGKIPTVGRVSRKGVTYKSMLPLRLGTIFSPVLIFPCVEPIHFAGQWLLGQPVPVSPGSVLCWTARTEKLTQGQPRSIGGTSDVQAELKAVRKVNTPDHR